VERRSCHNDRSSESGIPVSLKYPWHDGVMPKRSSPKRDFTEVARSGVLEHAFAAEMAHAYFPLLIEFFKHH
jgi:hypothetical protein